MAVYLESPLVIKSIILIAKKVIYNIMNSSSRTHIATVKAQLENLYYQVEKHSLTIYTLSKNDTPDISIYILTISLLTIASCPFGCAETNVFLDYIIYHRLLI